MLQFFIIKLNVTVDEAFTRVQNLPTWNS